MLLSIYFYPILMMNNVTTCREEGVAFIWKNYSYKLCDLYFEFSCSGVKRKENIYLSFLLMCNFWHRIMRCISGGTSRADKKGYRIRKGKWTKVYKVSALCSIWFVTYIVAITTFCFRGVSVWMPIKYLYYLYIKSVLNSLSV